MAPKLSIIAEVDDNKKLDGFIRNVKASLAGISCEMLLLCEENDLEGVDLASVCGESFSVKPLHDDREMPERLNTALAEAKGDVIHFTKSSCEYENKAIKDAVSLLDSQGDAHVACLDAAGFNSREEVLDVMPFIKKLELTKPVIIDLNKEPDRWCRALFSLFIDRDAALKVSFSTALEYEYERVYLAQLMADCDRYWLVPEKVTTTGSIDRDYYNYRPLYDKDWYLKELVELTSLVAPLEDTKRINQRLLLDFVKIQFSANSADRDKTILEGSLLEEYITKVKDTLKYIDDDIIATAGREVLPARVLAVMDHTFLCLKHNVDAIKTLKTLEAEKRPATDEEKETLSKYVGWGALAKAFDKDDPKWAAEYKELSELLTPQEYAQARSTVNDAFYTSPTVIDGIYEALGTFGFDGGAVLEPAMGIGNFFGRMPEDMQSHSQLYGVEIDSLSGRIAQALYPDADIAIQGFEQNRFQNGCFDVAVGNVPFGELGFRDTVHDTTKLHDFFFAEALDNVSVNYG